MEFISNTDEMFSYCSNLTSINLNFLEESFQWRYAYGMFYNCKSLKEIVFPIVKADHLYNTTQMFSGCTNLSHIDLSGLYTREIIDIHSMFENCINLIFLNIIHFDTSNLYFYEKVFYGFTNKIKIIYDPFITNRGFESEIRKIISLE